ncbi:MAG: hypothetical protein M3297_16725 [Thermoproteota archaeon]|nr:hypothetical protein [Thermoproteota archaeon]
MAKIFGTQFASRPHKIGAPHRFRPTAHRQYDLRVPVRVDIGEREACGGFGASGKIRMLGEHLELLKSKPTM